MRRNRVAGTALGLAVLLGTGCGSKAKLSGTPTSKVTAIELGRSVNADRTIKEASESFAPADTIYASIQTESLGSVSLKVRWTFEAGQTVAESTQAVPASGGIIWTGFHVSKPDGWPVGAYHLQVSLDGTVAGVKEFTVK